MQNSKTDGPSKKQGSTKVPRAKDRTEAKLSPLPRRHSKSTTSLDSLDKRVWGNTSVSSAPVPSSVDIDMLPLQREKKKTKIEIQKSREIN